MKKLICLFVLTLCACANVEPVIDSQAITDVAKYNKDLADCRALRDDAEKRASFNAIANFGDYSARNSIVKNCMTGRGYRVLNQAP